ncbi:MAG TPA: hypothetical protein VN325_44215 [Steroidobacteraceae bacterium]|nr:hypothetical protein [Steroidobacteraceae bacterium]
MKTGILGLGLTLTAAILASPAGAADHANSSVVGTARAASLSSSTRRAVNEFVDAYASRNSAGLAQATTGDFEVQYGLAQAGTYVSVDEDALIASWRDAGVNSARDGHSTIAIFPTADAHVVFVTYRTPGDAGSERIALLELRGHRVARARDLITPAPEFIELAGWTKNTRTVAADRDAARGQ